MDLGKGGAPPSVPYAPNDAIYDRFEDELMVQAAEASYCFPRTAAASAEDEDDDEEEGGGGKEKKKNKKKKAARKEGGGDGARASLSSQGYVVSLVPGDAVAAALPQMEEMVG